MIDWPSVLRKLNAFYAVSCSSSNSRSTRCKCIQVSIKTICELYKHRSWRMCVCARDKLVRYAKYKWIFLWLSNSQQIAFEKYTYKTYELVQVFIYSSNTPVVVSLPQQQHLCHFCYYLHHLLFYRPRNHFNQLSHNSTHSHEEQKKKRISPRKAINNTSRRKTYITLW